MSQFPPAQYNLEELMHRNNVQLKGRGKVEKTLEQAPPMIEGNHDADISTFSIDTDDSNSGANTRTVSGSSSANTNNTPQYGQALVWKSDRVKAQDEFHRVRARVKPIAPEMFKEKAYPSNEPADIMPRKTTEWIDFKSQATKDRLGEVTKSLDQMQSQLRAADNMNKDGISKEKRTILPVFGDEPGQKKIADPLSTVLSQPTIWSSNAAKAPQSNWPTQAELLEYGDQRGYDQFGNRANRSLPPPRVPAAHSEMSFQEQNFVGAHPMDQTGPYYFNQQGNLADPTPEDVQKANDDMDNDPMFEAQAMQWLGSDLMDHVGRFKKPKVPNWQEKQRRQMAQMNGVASGGALGNVSGADQLLEKAEQMSKEETLIRQLAAKNGVPAMLSWKYIGRDPFNARVCVFVDKAGRMKRYDVGAGWLDDNGKPVSERKS